MAEECVSVQFDDGTGWQYCWEDATPYPGWNSGDVTTGLRPGHAAEGGGGENGEDEEQPGGTRAWRSCQYFLKGMPSICRYWSEGSAEDEAEGTFSCSYEKDNTSDNPLDPKPEEPSGFNFGNCDYLGRRGWCSKYEESEEWDADKWICTAPNPYITGLGVKRVEGQTASFTPRTREQITGYNDAADGTGTGKCDCAGFGRGEAGCGIVGDFTGTTDKEMEKALGALPVMCNYYRPFSLGFGTVDPAKKLPGDVDVDGITITEQGWKRAEEWESDRGYRLPLNYILYNLRAKFQKCLWWEEETSRDFNLDNSGTSIYLEGAPDIFDAVGRVEFCKCPHTAAEDFNTRMFETVSGTTGFGWLLDGVWAKGKAGGPVCNGARAECPCYSGKWIYLTQSRMYPGMAVTANQILELRFWAQEWDNQQDYNDYYEQKPNFDDNATEAIYTFTKWTGKDQPGTEGDALAAIDITKAKMVGKRLTLCQPVPIHQKEFSKEYIVSEPIRYYAGDIGSDAAEGGQWHYPNLLRDPSGMEGGKPLTVVYPPFNDMPFSEDYCDNPQRNNPGYTKRSNNVYGDYIKTIGHTYANRRVYTINTVAFHYDKLIDEFSGIYAIKGKKVKDRSAKDLKNKIYNELRLLVSAAIEEGPEYINFTLSDDKFGFFNVPQVKLDYNKYNMLIVCVDYGDGTWEYRKRQVLSKWYGGAIKQVSYEHTYGNSDSGYSNPAPTTIGPPYGTATAELAGLGGSRGQPAEVVSTFSLDDIWRGLRYYDYSYEVVPVRESSQEFWGAVGNTNKILVAIDDINVNYIYDWTVQDAVLSYAWDDYDERKEKGLPVEVELEVLLIDDNYIGPNYCILQPKEDVRIRFTSGDWNLTLTYGYVKPTNSPDSDNSSVWGARRTENDILVDTPHSISSNGTTVEVAGIDKGAVQLLAHFKDEEGRNISAFATKLLVQIINESCRNVDIFYRYKATGKLWKLMPFTGFCIHISNDMPYPRLFTGGEHLHVETPNCGDHEHSWQKWEGPMWFPFNVCRGYDMYDEFTVCNSCQAGYVGPKNDGVATGEDGQPRYAGNGTVLRRNDYRYCGPHKYMAFGDTRGNWLSSCDCGCKFWYSDASAATVIFAGEGNIKTTVDLVEYAEYGWVPPPFGNEGRELMQKYISQDYVTHIVPYATGGILQRADWMPLVLNHDSFFATFNCYDENPEDEYVGISDFVGGNSFEPFRYVHQMSMATLPAIGEEMINIEDDEGGDTGIAERYRWEELFEPHHESHCSYPLPTYAVGTETTKTIFYYLKPDWAAWAWQEAWQEIERDIEGELPETPAAEGDEDDPRTTSIGQFNFVDFKKPRYVTDYHKVEHRRIVTEGDYQVIYTAPEVDDVGNMTKYPSLSLNGAHPRSFNIIYPENSYTIDKAVIWKDEGGQSDIQGSADEDNIYEEADGNDWLHEENMLFDSEAVSTTGEAEDAGRAVIVGESEFLIFLSQYEYKYFNRGIIAEMTRDRLYYLPKDEFDIEAEPGEGSTPLYEGPELDDIGGPMLWKGSATLVYTFEEPIGLSDISIQGRWGEVPGSSDADPPKPTIHTLVRPGVGISCTFADGTTGSPKGASTNASQGEYPEGEGVEVYNIDLYYLLGPIEMSTKKIKSLTLNLSTVYPGDFIVLESIGFVSAEYVNISYENITVHERKYVASKFVDKAGHGINLDGPGDHLHYDNDLHNMGQYFNFRGAETVDKELAAWDKTKVMACGVRHADDELLTRLDMDTLHELEIQEQTDLYNYAFDIDPMGGDVLSYAGITPFKLEDFMSNMGENFPTSTLTINSERLLFEKHWRYKSYKAYDFWRPGGHFYNWNTENITRQKCTLFSPPREFFQGKYNHVDHVGIGTPISEDASQPVDPGNSYYSLRFYVQQAKYDRAMILAGGDPEYTDKWGLGGGSSAGTFTT